MMNGTATALRLLLGLSRLCLQSVQSNGFAKGNPERWATYILRTTPVFPMAEQPIQFLLFGVVKDGKAEPGGGHTGQPKQSQQQQQQPAIVDDGKGTQRWGQFFVREPKGGRILWLLAAILVVLILAALIVFFLHSKAKTDERMAKSQQRRSKRRRGTLHSLPKESITI